MTRTPPVIRQHRMVFKYGLRYGIHSSRCQVTFTHGQLRLAVGVYAGIGTLTLPFGGFTELLDRIFQPLQEIGGTAKGYKPVLVLPCYIRNLLGERKQVTVSYSSSRKTK